MATEDFTTYTESDALGRLGETVDRVTWTDLLGTDDSIFLYDDKGVDFFDGSFTHHLTTKSTKVETGSYVHPWGLTNYLDDFTGIRVANEDALFLQVAGVPTPKMRLWEIYSRAASAGTAVSGTFVPTVGTVYYLKIVRDMSVGTYGTLYCYIYSNPGRTILLDTLSLTLHFSQKGSEFRYVELAASFHLPGSLQNKSSGYTEELEFVSVSAPATVTTQAVSNIGETTATANGNITDLGSPNPTAHGFAYSPTDTTPDIETASVTDEGAASSTGAFTSDLTGLTPGLLYYMRAYATNSAGTSYGSVVTVRGIRAVGAGYVWQDGPFVHFGGEDGNEVIYNPPLTVSGSEDPGYLWTEATELNVIDSAGDERSEEGTATGDTGPEGTAFIEGTELHYLDETAGAERTH